MQKEKKVYNAANIEYQDEQGNPHTVMTNIVSFSFMPVRMHHLLYPEHSKGKCGQILDFECILYNNSGFNLYQGSLSWELPPGMELYHEKVTIKTENHVIEREIKNQRISLKKIGNEKKVRIQYRIKIAHDIFKGMHKQKTRFQYCLSKSEGAVIYEEESNDSFIKVVKIHAE